MRHFGAWSPHQNQRKCSTVPGATYWPASRQVTITSATPLREGIQTLSSSGGAAAYPAHRSALTDVAKLRSSGFRCHLGILIYGVGLRINEGVLAQLCEVRPASPMGGRIEAPLLMIWPWNQLVDHRRVGFTPVNQRSGPADPVCHASCIFRAGNFCCDEGLPTSA